MIVFALGLPGRFSEWCNTAIVRVLEAAAGPTVPVEPGNAEELISGLLSAENGNVLVNGQQPQAWLHQILSSTNKPFIVALQDPRQAVWELMTQNGLDTTVALQIVATSCASMVSYISLPGALTLNADAALAEAPRTVQAIAAHLGLSLDAAESEQIAAGLRTILPVPEAEPAWDSGQLTFVEGAVNAYLDHFHGLGIGPISWTRELFLADGNQPATNAIDITGRPRALIYGPYIRLPPGHWVAEIVLGFSQESADMNFFVDVKTGDTVLSTTSIRPGSQGIFSVNLAFSIEENNDSPVEFRMMNERAAFDGRVMLGQATLSLQRTAASSAVELLREELGLTGQSVHRD